MTRTIRHDERGFGLVEALVGFTILTVGLLGIGAAFAQGMRALGGSNYEIIAREKAVEAVESVFSARDTKTITWAQIRNVNGETGNDGGVFLDGPKPLKLPGLDGLVNTVDDAAGLETLYAPGPDGMLGTPDDLQNPLSHHTREIKITTVNVTLRQIVVTVKYQIGQEERKYVLTTYISSYS